MTNPISKEALLLHAQALERDTPQNTELGRCWLLEGIGKTVRGRASALDWRLPNCTDAELGEAIWRRIHIVLVDAQAAEPPNDVIAQAVVANSAGNEVDETCITLLFSFGYSDTMIAKLAALWLRKRTSGSPCQG